MKRKMNEQPASTPRVTPCGDGYCYDGPGFYVWDKDPRIARTAATELQTGELPRHRPRRMLWVGPNAASYHTGDPEALDA